MSAFLAAGLRTPFSRVDGALAGLGAIELSAPVARAMAQVDSGSGKAGIRPDLVVWGTVAPNLGYSNIAREVLIDAGLDQTVPAFSTVMACSTSMAAAFQAASLLGRGGIELALAGGVESMSHVQIGLHQKLSDWLRRFSGARSIGERFDRVAELDPRAIKLHIPSLSNRSTGKSMGEHCEEMARAWNIARAAQDRIAFESHKRVVSAMAAGYFDELLHPLGEASRDTLPRPDTSLERLARLSPVFDRASGKGTITAGNSSPLTDGAAGIWIASEAGLKRLPASLPRARLLDWELAAVDIRTEGLLMAPGYAIPRLLARNRLAYADVQLYELHEAFAAQILCNVAALESATFRVEKAGVDAELGAFPWERWNPNGGSIALGHPFGATGARILSQAVKELAALGRGAKAIVSICADGGLGSVALLENS